jgi:hypothetical protein
VEGIVDGNHSVRILIADVETLARIHRLDKVGPNGTMGRVSPEVEPDSAVFFAFGSQPFSAAGFSCGFRISVWRTMQDSLNIGISGHPAAASMLGSAHAGLCDSSYGGTGGQDLGPGR